MLILELLEEGKIKGIEYNLLLDWKIEIIKKQSYIFK